MSTPSTSDMETVERYLRSNGFTVLDRIWDNADQGRLLAAEHRCLVTCLVNVQTSTSNSAGSLALPRATTRKLRASARRWMAEHERRYDLTRIDLATLVHEGSAGFTIEHIREAG